MADRDHSNHFVTEEETMKRQAMHYDTLLRVARAISETKDVEQIVQMAVASVRNTMKAKGCSMFLINRKTKELELAASYGLSDEYLQKGPVSHLHSIQESLEEGPVAICDVMDDPRIQYPEEAKREGIRSILGVPILIHGNVIGVMRIYTSEAWNYTLAEVDFVQAVAQICGMAIDICRLHKGYKTSIEILKTMRNPRELRSRKRTPHEGIPVSIGHSICTQVMQ